MSIEYTASQKAGSFRLNRTTVFLGLFSFLPFSLYSSYSLAQDCQLEKSPYSENPYYSIRSDNPEEYCTIPKDKSEEFFGIM